MEIMKTFDEITVNAKSNEDIIAALSMLSDICMDNYNNKDFVTKFIITIGKEVTVNNSNGFRPIVNVELNNPKVRVSNVGDQPFLTVEDNRQSLRNINLSKLKNLTIKKFIDDSKEDWGGAEPLYTAYRISFSDENNLDYKIVVRVYTEKGAKYKQTALS